MTRGKYTLLAGTMLAIFLAAQVTDLDLGAFGYGLIIIAAVFGLMAVVSPRERDSENG